MPSAAACRARSAVTSEVAAGPVTVVVCAAASPSAMSATRSEHSPTMMLAAVAANAASRSTGTSSRAASRSVTASAVLDARAAASGLGAEATATASADAVHGPAFARPAATLPASLSVSIPAVRAGRDELVALAPLALDAAATLSARLGHAPG